MRKQIFTHIFYWATIVLLLTFGTAWALNIDTDSNDAVDLAYGGTNASLSDPGADRILCWDASAGVITWCSVGTGISFSATPSVGLHAYLTDIASISASKGDLLYFNGTDWIRLPIGTDGYIIYVSTDVPAYTNSLAISYLTLPNAANPTPTTEARIHWDSNEDWLALGDGAATKVISPEHCETYTIPEPDQRTDDIVLKHFPAEVYPNGITVTYVAVTTSSAASDTHTFEHWSDRAGTVQTTVEAVQLSAAQKAESSAIDDADVEQDFYIVLNLDDATDDTDYLEAHVCYVVQTNN